MESHTCKKHRGVGPHVSFQTPDAEPCRQISSSGGRCRMLAMPDSGLCAHHARRAQLAEVRANEAVAKELLADVEDFTSAETVNLFLGNLIKQVVRKRVSRRDAIALAYLSQLLLNSLSAMGREQDREREQEPEETDLEYHQRVVVPYLDRVFRRGKYKDDAPATVEQHQISLPEAVRSPGEATLPGAPQPANATQAKASSGAGHCPPEASAEGQRRHTEASAQPQRWYTEASAREVGR